MLTNNKHKSEIVKNSGVYKIKCKDAVYGGQCGGNMDTQVKEHCKSVLDNNKNSGSFYTL